MCYEALAAKLAQVLVLSLEDMDPSITVGSLGLDSLVAIEIRNWIAREANANVQVLGLLSSGTLMALAESIVNKSLAYTRTDKEADTQSDAAAYGPLDFMYIYYVMSRSCAHCFHLIIW